MKAFCIPKSLAANLKSAAQRGEINIKDLYNMDSDGRRAVFEKYTDAETARNINIGFEESIVSTQKTALESWAKKTFTGDQKSKEYKDVLDKVNQLDEVGALSLDDADGFLGDLVAAKLGIGVSQAEVQKIIEFTTELQDIAEKNPTNKFGQPSMEYLKKRQEINKYIDSLTPSNPLALLSNTVGRANMLFSPKTIALNIWGNSGLLALEAAVRRIATGVVKGSNGDLVRDYIKEQTRIYVNTEFDLSRMIDPEFTPTTLGEKRLTSEGKGTVRKISRMYEDTIFKYGLGTPDAFFAAVNFADSLDIYSTQQAQREKLKGDAVKARARELFLDATKIEPQSEIGQKLRAKAIMDAQVGTGTQNSALAQISLKIRDVFNNASGDIRAGDLLIPFAKTPANFIAIGLDYSGLGLIKAVKDFAPAWKEMKRGNFELWDKVKVNAIKSGVGMTLAFILVSMLEPEDYQPEYPAGTFEGKARDLFNLENKVADSIRIGDKWVSLDYFGALAPFMKGFIANKTYQDQNDPLGKAFAFVQGELGSLKELPGLREGQDTLTSMFNNLSKANPDVVSDVKDDAYREVVEFIASRTIPAFLSDFAKMTDDVERKTDYSKPLEQIKAKIPGLRQELPAKINIFGEEVKTEQPLSVLLFGSRLKTRQQSEIIDEITRLDKAGFAPTVADPEKTSDRLKDFKNQVSADKYKEAITEYRSNLKENWSELIDSNKYEKVSEEEKQKLLNEERTEILDKILKKYRYKKPKK